MKRVSVAMVKKSTKQDAQQMDESLPSAPPPKKSGQVGRPRKNAASSTTNTDIANHTSLEQVTNIKIEKPPSSSRAVEKEKKVPPGDGIDPSSHEQHPEKIIVHLNTKAPVHDASHHQTEELEKFYQLNEPHAQPHHEPPSAYPPRVMYYNMDDYYHIDDNDDLKSTSQRTASTSGYKTPEGCSSGAGSRSLTQYGNKECSSECKVVQLLREFDPHTNGGIWPMSTNVACHWCCHRFFTVPFGIPIKYAHDQFYCFGCFCSLECALAYNLYSTSGADDVWERNNLIHFLGKRIQYSHNVLRPAPPRCCLKMFGGYLSIEEFRRYSQQDRYCHVNFPPMISVSQQVEEINNCDINHNNEYIPLDTERINKYKEKMRLKRTKPIHDSRSTLDHAINIKITSGETSAVSAAAE